MKDLTLIIPVYNEEAILEAEIGKIILTMNQLMPGTDYEVLIVENGSLDSTKEIISRLVKKYSLVRAINLKAAGYGLALKAGLKEGLGKYLVVFNIDFWDVDFVVRALKLMPDSDLVIGSKNMPGAQDQRSWLRRAVTRSFNIFLNLFFGFKGTDTHGLKVIVKEKIMDFVNQCRTDRAIFDTEFVLRSQRAGLKVKEIPVSCMEKRKTRFHIVKSLVQTIKDIIILFMVLRKPN